MTPASVAQQVIKDCYHVPLPRRAQVAAVIRRYGFSQDDFGGPGSFDHFLDDLLAVVGQEPSREKLKGVLNEVLHGQMLKEDGHIWLFKPIKLLDTVMAWASGEAGPLHACDHYWELSTSPGLKELVKIADGECPKCSPRPR